MTIIIHSFTFIFFIRVFGYFKHICKPYLSGGERGVGGGIIQILNSWFLCVLCYFLLRGK